MQEKKKYLYITYTQKTINLLFLSDFFFFFVSVLVSFCARRNFAVRNGFAFVTKFRRLGFSESQTATGVFFLSPEYSFFFSARADHRARFSYLNRQSGHGAVRERTIPGFRAIFSILFFSTRVRPNAPRTEVSASRRARRNKIR